MMKTYSRFALIVLASALQFRCSGALPTGSTPLATEAYDEGTSAVASSSKPLPHILAVGVRGTPSSLDQVTSSPGSISCTRAGGPRCSQSFPHGTTVVLTARPSSRSTFLGWRGCTWTSGPTCTVMVTEGRPLIATFAAR